MKKPFILLLLIVTSTIGYGQGFYLRTGLSYAFPQAGQSIDANGTPYNGTYSGTTGTYSIKSASLSSGLQGMAGFGYLISRHVGVELDLNFGLAPKKYSFSASQVRFSAATVGDLSFEMQAKTMVLAIPSIVLQNGGDVWNIYSRFGVVLPLNTEVTMDEIQGYNLGTGSGTRVVDDFTFSMKNSFSLGFAAAVGVQYKLTERMSLWGEVSMVSLSVYAKQKKLTAVTENGVSYSLSSVSGNQVVNYSKNYTEDSTGANQATYAIPYSSVGISVGIRISMFGNSKNPSKPIGKGDHSRRPKAGNFR